MAVYTTIADDEISALLQGYDIRNLRSLAGIAEGVENSNFILPTDKDTCI